MHSLVRGDRDRIFCMKCAEFIAMCSQRIIFGIAEAFRK
ncbi:hypothetical protein D083_0756 [Dickeya solani RNS 08.23.3.1.A]|nr:hypothetical protein D083_0756 [Dickeya solani RNS 08.23.3.1.A]